MTLFTLLACMALLLCLISRQGLFTLLSYTLTTAAAGTNLGMTASTDPDFSTRNSHYIFSEPYQLLAAYATGANITRVNMIPPSWNAFAPLNIWPMNLSSTQIVANPQWDLWVNYPPQVPQNEEFVVQVSDTAAAGELASVVLALGTADWSQNIPKGLAPVPIVECRITGTSTIAAKGYSALVTPTFEQSLRGGVYAVVGAQFQCAAAMYARLVFPRQRLYNGRKLRPGTLVSQTIGDVPQVLPPFGAMFWGLWGYFSTFEPPQVEFFGFTAGGATNWEGRLYLVYISTDMNVPV